MNDTIEAALGELERALGLFVESAGPVYLHSEGDNFRRWRFETEEPRQLLVVKAARVVSGLRALGILLDAGHVIEAGVLIRTVDDFLDDILYVVEAGQRPGPTSGQTAFVSAFFAEQVHPDHLLEDRPGLDRTKRKEIRAAAARLLSPTKPHRVTTLNRALDFAWDGYVHGAYQQSMELWNSGGTPNGFCTHGVSHPTLLETYRRQLAVYTQRSLNTFALIASVIDLPGLRDSLVTTRKTMEESSDSNDI
jgi:hypothetical protein